MAFRQIFALALPLAVLALSSCQRVHVPPYSESAEMKVLADYAKDLADPRGDLAFTRNVPLRSAPVTFGRGADNTVVLEHWGLDPLKLQVQGSDVIVLNNPAGTTLDGKQVTSGFHIPLSKRHNSHWIVSDKISLGVYSRGQELAAQIYDAQSTALQQIHPLNWFPPAPQYRVAAVWNPSPFAKPTTMHRTNGGSDYQTTFGGTIEFSINGQPFKLYGTVYDDQIFVVFRDLTSKTETYPSGRFLEVEFASDAFDPGHKFDPKQKTSMAVDFNRAINPVCAYNPNTRCPIAPPQNRLPISIPAGEKRYHKDNEPVAST